MAFRFKQFSVDDELSSMKVGTDAVLLGAWAGNRNITSILDIGTGCGIVALMMAQRFNNAEVVGIDIHPESTEQAGENFKASPWESRLRAENISLQIFSEISKQQFDLIVSNPPYFKDSLLPPDPSRERARHTTSLSYEELVQCSVVLLKDMGSLSLILPFEGKDMISCIMKKYKLHLRRELDVIPVRGKVPNRFLSEWGLHKTSVEAQELTIRLDPHTYTKAYKELGREFYLAL